MSDLKTFDAVQKIGSILVEFEDPEMRRRILLSVQALIDGSFVQQTSLHTAKIQEAPVTQSKDTSLPRRRSSRGKSKNTLTMVKGLNLRPTGSIALSEFVDEKKPSSNDDKIMISIYYLKEILGVEEISSDHVYTCFKTMEWKVPANLNNAMQIIASQKGWLNTRNNKNIILEITGENFVVHDLPKKKK